MLPPRASPGWSTSAPSRWRSRSRPGPTRSRAPPRAASPRPPTSSRRSRSSSAGHSSVRRRPRSRSSAVRSASRGSQSRASGRNQIVLASVSRWGSTEREVDMKSTLTRRALLGATAGVAASAALNSRAGSALAGATATAAPAPILPADRIACQLYSVRDQVDGVGFAQVFKKLAAIGYKEVEFTQYTQSVGPITLAQIRNLLSTYGLTAVGSHVSPSSDASMKKILDDAQAIGIPNVGISFEVPQGLTTSAWQSLADQWNHYGAMAAARKIGFYFHNHFQEFA